MLVYSQIHMTEFDKKIYVWFFVYISKQGIRQLFLFFKLFMADPIKSSKRKSNFERGSIRFW